MRKHNESSRRYANSKKVTQLVNVEEHVEGFRQSEAHRRELIDDYVELISDLIRKWGSSSGGHGCSSGSFATDGG